jgi:hypothetical protein
VKTITSPTAAVTLLGLNVRVPLAPTVTGILAAETAVAAAKRVTKEEEKRMFTTGTYSAIENSRPRYPRSLTLGDVNFRKKGGFWEWRKAYANLYPRQGIITMTTHGLTA